MACCASVSHVKSPIPTSIICGNCCTPRLDHASVGGGGAGRSSPSSTLSISPPLLGPSPLSPLPPCRTSRGLSSVITPVSGLLMYVAPEVSVRSNPHNPGTETPFFFSHYNLACRRAPNITLIMRTRDCYIRQVKIVLDAASENGFSAVI